MNLTAAIEPRTCRLCNETKPLTDYPRSGRTNKNGSEGRCRACTACTYAQRKARRASRPHKTTGFFPCAVCGAAVKSRLSETCSLPCRSELRRRDLMADPTVWEDGNGYLWTWTPEGHKRQHRYVMEQILGRELGSHETVHHKNGDRKDNRAENLEVWVGRHGRGASHSHCSTCRCFEDMP